MFRKPRNVQPWTNEQMNERTNERTSRSAEPGTLVQGRFGMLITDQHTYPSPAPASPTRPIPLAVSYLGCQPIRLGTAPIAGLVARRARVRPTSRPYDPRTPRNTRFALFRARCESGETPARPYNTWPSSSSNGLLRFLALKANLIERSVEGPRRQPRASETEIASRDLWSTVAQIGCVGTPSRRLSHDLIGTRLEISIN